MKKFILCLIVSILLCVNSFATTVLYRTSSNEVTGIDINDGMFTDHHEHLSVATEVSIPDGAICRDAEGDLRVIGYSKILDGNVVRNATQAEIDTFYPAFVNDYAIDEAQAIVNYINKDEKFRRIIIALIKGIIREDNENRLWIRDFKAAVAASTSLADFQSRVAALDTPVDREFQDAKDYIISQVSKDD